MSQVWIRAEKLLSSMTLASISYDCYLKKYKIEQNGVEIFMILINGQFYKIFFI